MQNHPLRLALRASLLYGILAGLWILFSDQMLMELVPDPQMVGKLEIFKGWMFVAVTAALLFVILKRTARRLEIEALERKKLERSLLEREEQYHRVVETMPDCIFILKQNRFVLVNAAALKLFGARRQEELLGRDVFDFIHPDFYDIVRDRIRQAAQQDEPLPSIEEKLLRLDGTMVEVETVSRRFQFQGEPALLVAVSDITRLKQSEKSLSLFRDQIDASSDAFEVIDPATGRFLDVNLRGCSDLGYSREEFLTLRVFDVDPLVKTSDWEKIMETLRKTGAMVFQGIHRRKDGSTFPVEVNTRLVYLNQDYIVTVVRDVTARKQAEAKVRQLSHAVEQSPVSVVITDTKGNIEYVNRKFTELTGYSFDEAVGQNPRILKSGELNANEYQKLWSTILAGGTWSGEFHNRKKNGELYWESANISPIFDDTGCPTHFVAVKEDITQRRLVASSLQASEERYRLVTENAADLITVVDALGVIRFQSPSVERILGYKAEAMINRNGFEFIHPEDVAQTAAAVKKTLSDRTRPVSVEFRFRHCDGSWRTLQAIGNCLPNTLGDECIVVSSRDVTDNRKLEEQFRQSQKMDAFGQLAGGVAHDFNNILAVIQMQAGLLRTEQNIPSTQMDFAAEIEKAAQRAANLTRQLLMFSRRQTLQPYDLDLKDVVSNVTKMLHRIIGEDIQMQLKFASQSVFVHADAGMMDQILLNLTVNARDAMPKGGQLVIETSTVDLDWSAASQIANARPGSFACLSVGDTGGGIPPEILPRIFEPFFTTKDVGKGTGLGLATVFGIVQQHQGWINVETEPGQGTTFRIYFPRLVKAVDQKPRTPTLASMKNGNETILLVEDDASLRKSVRTTLSRLGYKVLEAMTGVEALEVWKEHHEEISLLLTDMVMPDGMNGIELAGNLLLQKPRLKVIYASGYSTEVAGKDFPLHDGVNFLAKPFAAHKLATTVRECLDKN